MRKMTVLASLALGGWSAMPLVLAQAPGQLPNDPFAKMPDGWVHPKDEKIADNLVAIEMIPVKGGSIEMLPINRDGKVDPKGAPEKVAVKPFSISRTEVTWALYYAWHIADSLPKTQKEAIVGKSRPSKPYESPDHGWGNEVNPAIHIHPLSADWFCKWLSAKTGKTYRLPTEAEWEFACRAGGGHVGLDAPLPKAELGKIAWYDDNSDNDDVGGEKTSHPVAKKTANALGLYDMLGNAAEWCVGRDGRFVLKGGSWQDRPKDINSWNRKILDANVMQQRDPQDPKSKWWLSDGHGIGFRVVRED